MHLEASYVTGPSAVFFSAPTRQATVRGQSRAQLSEHGVQPCHVVLHPGHNHRALYQVFLVEDEVRRLHDGDPAVLEGIPREQVWLLDHVVVDRSDNPFDGGEQIQGRSANVDRGEFLTLPDPAVGADDFDLINFSEQVGGKAVQPDPRVLVALLHDPGVPRMKAVVLRNGKPVFPLDTRRLWAGPRLRLGWCFLAGAEVADRQDQQKHQEYEEYGH